jgi:hypothetical protein
VIHWPGTPDHPNYLAPSWIDEGCVHVGSSVRGTPSSWRGTLR